MTAIPMTIPQQPYKLVWDDYAAMPDDGRRYEILDGELVMTPAPIPHHQRVSQRLEQLLIRALEETGLGVVYHAPIGVQLGDHDIVEPDILFIRTANKHIIGKARIKGAPDLLIEILSPSTRRRDVLVKSGLYARCGVPAYWIADPAIDKIECFRLHEGNYELVASGSAPDVLAVQGFEGLELDLSYVFEPV